MVSWSFVVAPSLAAHSPPGASSGGVVGVGDSRLGSGVGLGLAGGALGDGDIGVGLGDMGVWLGLGVGDVALGDGDSVLGDGDSVLGDGDVALGDVDVVLGDVDVVLGDGDVALGDGDVALGNGDVGLALGDMGVGLGVGGVGVMLRLGLGVGGVGVALGLGDMGVALRFGLAVVVGELAGGDEGSVISGESGESGESDAGAAVMSMTACGAGWPAGSQDSGSGSDAGLALVGVMTRGDDGLVVADSALARGLGLALSGAATMRAGALGEPAAVGTAFSSGSRVHRAPTPISGTSKMMSKLRRLSMVTLGPVAVESR